MDTPPFPHAEPDAKDRDFSARRYVSLLPKRGPGPPHKVALFDSAEGGRVWADLVTKTARKNGQLKVVVRLAGDTAVLVSTGVPLSKTASVGSSRPKRRKSPLLVQ